MKLHPPKSITDESDSFKSSLFWRSQFAESLTDLLRATAENLVVFVNASRGKGETTFAEMCRADLKNNFLGRIGPNPYASGTQTTSGQGCPDILALTDQSAAIW